MSAPARPCGTSSSPRARPRSRPWRRSGRSGMRKRRSAGGSRRRMWRRRRRQRLRMVRVQRRTRMRLRARRTARWTTTTMSMTWTMTCGTMRMALVPRMQTRTKRWRTEKQCISMIPFLTSCTLHHMHSSPRCLCLRPPHNHPSTLLQLPPHPILHKPIPFLPSRLLNPPPITHQITLPNNLERINPNALFRKPTHRTLIPIYRLPNPPKRNPIIAHQRSQQNLHPTISIPEPDLRLPCTRNIALPARHIQDLIPHILMQLTRRKRIAPMQAVQQRMQRRHIRRPIATQQRHVDREEIRAVRKRVCATTCRHALAQLPQRRQHGREFLRRELRGRDQPRGVETAERRGFGRSRGGVFREGEVGERGREGGGLGVRVCRGEERVEVSPVEGAQFHVALGDAVEEGFLRAEVVESGVRQLDVHL